MKRLILLRVIWEQQINSHLHWWIAIIEIQQAEGKYRLKYRKILHPIQIDIWMIIITVPKIKLKRRMKMMKMLEIFPKVSFYPQLPGIKSINSWNNKIWKEKHSLVNHQLEPIQEQIQVKTNLKHNRYVALLLSRNQLDPIFLPF